MTLGGRCGAAASDAAFTVTCSEQRSAFTVACDEMPSAGQSDAFGTALTVTFRA
ncbi:MAG: hypothetical protein ACLFVO_26985 [Chloroflexaceae bacterium]